MAAATLLTAALAAAAPATARQPAAAGPTPAPTQVQRSPSHAGYTVRLHQDDERGRRWTGTEAITFRNTGDAPLDRVDLRLWPNGPSRSGSTAPT